ncbi:MAG: transpeptidase family protein [Acidobacteria bacterium]|nr:transpeptidase family protein [Acidobacteriota bacterium]
MQQVPEKPAFEWRTIVRRRLVIAAAGLVAWSAAIEARLVYLQVARHADLTARAERQQLRTVETAAKRGDILDRNGRVLAFSVDAESIYAVPTDIADPERAAAALCRALDDCHARERQAIADRIRRGRAFAYVRRQVSPDEAHRVAALALDGIGFMKESRRFYPNKELTAHVLGYVGVDNNGLDGLEAAYDSLIKGRPGTVLVQTDARRQAFSRIERPPTAGATLELTIDRYLQHIAERELRAGVERAGAAGGSVVVMDPATGEILALANYPTFNPNTYREHGDDERRNRAVQDLYEPGSTFKIVTAGAALEDGLLAPDTPVETSPGRIRFGSRVIDEDRGHDYGLLSFTDVIVRSSNVGAVKVGLQLGPERFGMYVRRFGFGRRSSPDFPGESPGIVWNSARLTDSALASVSMGYQVGVTPIQMAAAVSAVANGGELIEPRVVRGVIADGTRAAVPRKVVRRAVSPGTAAVLTDMMEQVVERGTGTRARVPGFPVAGKTGTAQKVVGGRYSTSDYNVSFVGFVPSRQPVFAIVVVVDSPRAVPPYGGTVAAPIFQRIAEAGLRLYGVPPSLNPAPPVIVARREEMPPQPASGPATVPAIVTLGGGTTGTAALFPDLRWLGARDALRMLARLGLTARLHGTGVVVDQDPPPGSPVERGAVSTLRLERHAGTAAPAPIAAAPGGGP